MQISLSVKGKGYIAWEGSNLTKDITHCSRSFEFVIPPNEIHQSYDWDIEPWDECQVFIDNILQLTGYIELIAEDLNKNSHTRTISGRSKTADIVDCSCVHKPNNFKLMTVKRIIELLVKPFGIKVLGDDGDKIPYFAINHGETVFDACDRLLKRTGLLLTDTVKGELMLTSFKLQGPSDNTIRAFETMNLTTSVAGRFSHYVVRGQKQSFDDDVIESQTMKGIAVDELIPRYRPHVEDAEGNATPAFCEKKAKWMMNRSIGESTDLTVQIPAKEVWDINTLVDFKTEQQKQIEGQFLVVGVSHIQDRNSSYIRLTLKNPYAFSKEPEALKKRIKKSTGQYKYTQ